MVSEVKTVKNDYQNWTDEKLWEAYAATGSMKIKQELALRYLDSVRTVALQMRNVEVGVAQLDDHVHEGVIVIMNAIDKFDIHMNVKFETFVSKRIRGMIIDMARKQDWVPRTVKKNAKDIDEAVMKLYGRNGRMPTAEETAEYLNMPLDKYEKTLSKASLFYILSLDMLMEEKTENGNPKNVQIPSMNAGEQPEESYLGNEFKEILMDGIKSLKENEQTVISLYYMEELSAREIARILEVSEPRISQIHSGAIRKLRMYINEKLK